MSQILSNIIQILSELRLELGEREKQNLATAPGKPWLEVAWGDKYATRTGCQNHSVWGVSQEKPPPLGSGDWSWHWLGRGKEKSMFLRKHGYKATAPGPMAGTVTRTLALVLRRDIRALGTGRNEKNKREQILASSSWRRGYRVFVWKRRVWSSRGQQLEGQMLPLFPPQWAHCVLHLTSIMTVIKIQDTVSPWSDRNSLHLDFLLMSCRLPRPSIDLWLSGSA